MTEREKNQFVARRLIVGVTPFLYRTMQPILPLCEVRLPLVCGQGAFVGKIIRHTREGIDGGDMRPHRPRQEPRRDGKILVVRARHGFARVVGTVERAVIHRGILGGIG